MNSAEIEAVGELAGEAAAGLASQIQELHRGIARRTFGAVGPGAAVVKSAHDAIAGAAYAGAKTLTRSLVKAGASAVRAAQPPDAPSLERATVGRFAIGALNGAFGDTLERRRNALAIEMTVRAEARDLELTRPALAAAFPFAAPRVAVFVHGLCETDESWELGAARHIPYGYRLQAELGYTPVYIRYNTGRHISDNGHELARILDRLNASWPVELHEIALIGHSMGGLVSRSACHYGADSPWAPKVRHVFTLGAPHLGAPLEQVVNRATATLARLPETRMLAEALNLRSVGIKDLRYGYLVEEDWLGVDCDAYLRKAAREIPFLPAASHYFVCATITRSPDAPLGRVIGDLLVLKASAWSHTRGQRMRFPIEHYQHVGGANHFELLNHPAIYAQIRKWMAPRTALPAPGETS